MSFHKKEIIYTGNSNMRVKRMGRRGISTVCFKFSKLNKGLKEQDGLNGLLWGDDLEEIILFRQIITNSWQLLKNKNDIYV